MKKKIDGIWYTALIPIVLALLGFVLMLLLKPQLSNADQHNADQHNADRKSKCDQLKTTIDDMTIYDNKLESKVLKPGQKVEKLLTLVKNAPTMSATLKDEYEKLLVTDNPTHETITKQISLANDYCRISLLGPTQALWNAFDQATSSQKKSIREYALNSAKETQIKDITHIGYMVELVNYADALDKKILLLNEDDARVFEPFKKKGESFKSKSRGPIF